MTLFSHLVHITSFASYTSRIPIKKAAPNLLQKTSANLAGCGPMEQVCFLLYFMCTFFVFYITEVLVFDMVQKSNEESTNEWQPHLWNPLATACGLALLPAQVQLLQVPLACSAGCQLPLPLGPQLLCLCHVTARLHHTTHQHADTQCSAGLTC